MAKPLPGGRKWNHDEEKQLIDLLLSGAKAPAIAHQLQRSAGAVHNQINVLKKSPPRRASLPSERLVAAHALASKDRSIR
jgi:hypothetical protein